MVSGSHRRRLQTRDRSLPVICDSCLSDLHSSFITLAQDEMHKPPPVWKGRRVTKENNMSDFSRDRKRKLMMLGGLGLGLEGTMMGLPETRLGIVPLAGGVERIAARAGLGRGRTVALGGALHPAEEFAAWGVIDHVLSADELHSAADEFARRLAAGPSRAFAVVKELARGFTAGGVAGADAVLIDAAVRLFDTEDARGGIHSFLTSGPGHATFAGR